ncbi:MAG: MSMEG_4193 family putative phosphomutase [Tetrasphaera sp.]
MPLLLLIRHGRTAANTGAVLAGWTPGVGLDETGQGQVSALAELLGGLPVRRLVASPLQRARETAAPLAAAWGLEPVIEEDLGECRYGAWTGRPIAELVKEPLWPTIQATPSRARFPDGPDHPGESLAEMSARAVAAVCRHDHLVADEHGPHAIWAAVSHGDVVKAIIADALGSHLDQFQRIHVATASVSVLRIGPGRPMLLRVNGTGHDLTELLAPPPDPTPAGDGQVGGGR